MNAHILEMGYDNGYFYKWDWWAKTTYTPDSETNPTANAYLFARNGSSVTYWWGVRIYYLEWKRNDWTDVAHLIPAQRDSDWVLGMYDLVSETFLAPSGSGTWAWSPLGNVINFTNDSGYITSSALSWYQTTANLKTSLTDNSDSYYPSQKAVKTAVDGKQDALSSQTAYTSKWSATKVPQITTNSLWQVTNISEVTITQPTVPTNVSAFNNDAWYTTNTGTITSVKMNGSTVSSSGEADLWTVITSHQTLKTVNNQSIVGSWNVSVWTLTAETVVSGDSGTTYTIKVANSDPASWTPATTITFVL